jgi:hypothetical protein
LTNQLGYDTIKKTKGIIKMKKAKFEVKASLLNECKYLTKGNIYKVYSVSYPKLNKEGMFLIIDDSGTWGRYSAFNFEPVD